MEEQWIDVAAVADVAQWDVLGVQVGGRDVALYLVDGAVFATDNLCTHGVGRLSEGFLEGREIECPLHQGRFDVCTGAALCAPLTQAVRTYAVRIEDLRVMLKLG